MEPGARRGSRRLELGGRGARPGVQTGAVCRTAAGSCSRLGAPGPGEGERPLARSMSFSDSSATFLLNEVTAGAPSPEGWEESSGIWEKLQHGEGGKTGGETSGGERKGRLELAAPPKCADRADGEPGKGPDWKEDCAKLPL